MTLILALKWVLGGKEGVVVSSDSKVTVGPVSYETRKVYPIILTLDGKSVPLAIAGGAGDASLIKQSYRICERVLSDLAARECEKKTPSFDQFEKAVKQIETIFIKRFRELRGAGFLKEPSPNSIDRLRCVDALYVLTQLEGLHGNLLTSFRSALRMKLHFPKD